MMTTPADPHHALLLVTGALVALVGSGRARETDQVTFTAAFAELGSRTIADILDIADAALAPKPDTLTGVDL